MVNAVKNLGKIVQIVGAVVDVEFDSECVSDICNALVVENKQNGSSIVLEVQQLLGEGRVRTVTMSSTDGLSRGLPVVDTNSTIEMPVGTEVLGRILNVIGEPVHGKGPVVTEKSTPYTGRHRHLLIRTQVQTSSKRG